jgi:purine-binding chemotaxis protein CheW
MSIYDGFSDKERAVLLARAERAARQLLTDTEKTDLTTLSVTVRSEVYTLPIECVLAVYENVPIVPIPCTPPYIAGIANIRGHILPVADLSALLGAPPQTPSSSAALVIVSEGDLSLAFRVDEIGAVQALSTTGLTPLASNLDLPHSVYLKGMLSDGSVLLDVKAILNDPALIVNDAITEPESMERR